MTSSLWPSAEIRSRKPRMCLYSLMRMTERLRRGTARAARAVGARGAAALGQFWRRAILTGTQCSSFTIRTLVKFTASLRAVFKCLAQPVRECALLDLE